MTERKIVQLVAPRPNGITYTIALCNDGTVWAMFSCEDASCRWVALPPIPQPGKNEAT